MLAVLVVAEQVGASQVNRAVVTASSPSLPVLRQDLGITHFVLSDTPYKQEAARVGDHLLSRLCAPAPVESIR